MLRERGKIPLKSHSTGTFPSFLECQCEDLRLKSSGEHPPFPALSPGPLSSCNTAPYRQDLSLPITTAAVGEDFITRVFQINSFELPQKGVTCSNRMKYFLDPVSINCGHNFCCPCLSLCWQTRTDHDPSSEEQICVTY